MSQATKTAACAVIASLVSVAASAQMVVRDPLSGALRAPTADESQQLKPAAAPAQQTLAAKVSPRTGAIGSRMTDDSLSYAVVVRAADGSLQHACLADKAIATAVVAQGKPMTSFARPIALTTALPTE